MAPRNKQVVLHAQEFTEYFTILDNTWLLSVVLSSKFDSALRCQWDRRPFTLEGDALLQFFAAIALGSRGTRRRWCASLEKAAPLKYGVCNKLMWKCKKPGTGSWLATILSCKSWRVRMSMRPKRRKTSWSSQSSSSSQSNIFVTCQAKRNNPNQVRWENPLFSPCPCYQDRQVVSLLACGTSRCFWRELWRDTFYVQSVVVLVSVRLRWHFIIVWFLQVIIIIHIVIVVVIVFSHGTTVAAIVKCRAEQGTKGHPNGCHDKQAKHMDAAILPPRDGIGGRGLCRFVVVAADDRWLFCMTMKPWSSPVWRHERMSLCHHSYLSSWSDTVGMIKVGVCVSVVALVCEKWLVVGCWWGWWDSKTHRRNIIVAQRENKRWGWSCQNSCTG